MRWTLSGDAGKWLPVRLSLHVLVILGLTMLAAMTLWDFFAARFSSTLSDELKVDIVRLIMYVIAGLGGMAALVIAYRRQRLGEAKAVLEQAAETREQTKAFNEQFAAAAEQLSSDKAANRLAGVYAMASLADDWDQGRQTCINVLCAYIRMPYSPPKEDPNLGTDDARKQHQEHRAEHQVRRTVMDVIGERLRAEPIDGKTWHGQDFDFSGAVLDSGNLRDIKITGGRIDFSGAEFPGGRIDFSGAEFAGGQVDFIRAKFTGSQVRLIGAKFTGSEVFFSGAQLSAGQLDFGWTEFFTDQVDFSSAKFTGGQLEFDGAKFTGSKVDFIGAKFTGSEVYFGEAEFTGGQVRLIGAEFIGGEVYFGGAEFTGGQVFFSLAKFIGGEVYFGGAEFTGGQVDFREPQEWSQPPVFDAFPEGRPTGLLLPEVATDQ